MHLTASARRWRACLRAILHLRSHSGSWGKRWYSTSTKCIMCLHAYACIYNYILLKLFVTVSVVVGFTVSPFAVQCCSSQPPTALLTSLNRCALANYLSLYSVHTHTHTHTQSGFIEIVCVCACILCCVYVYLLQPPFIVTLDDLELVHFERVQVQINNVCMHAVLNCFFPKITQSLCSTSTYVACLVRSPVSLLLLCVWLVHCCMQLPVLVCSGVSIFVVVSCTGYHTVCTLFVQAPLCCSSSCTLLSFSSST